MVQSWSKSRPKRAASSGEMRLTIVFSIRVIESLVQFIEPVQTASPSRAMNFSCIRPSPWTPRISVVGEAEFVDALVRAAFGEVAADRFELVVDLRLLAAVVVDQANPDAVVEPVPQGIADRAGPPPHPGGSRRPPGRGGCLASEMNSANWPAMSAADWSPSAMKRTASVSSFCRRGEDGGAHLAQIPGHSIGLVEQSLLGMAAI